MSKVPQLRRSAEEKRVLWSAPRRLLGTLLASSLLLGTSNAPSARAVDAAVKGALARPPAFPELSSFPKPHWPQPVQPPAGAPNVLVIMTDDVGFAASSTFGGPVPTPTFSALAENGAEYNYFNTTSICSPSRASLLTGRDPHSIQFGSATASLPDAYDGYTSVMPKSAATIAEILKEHGYATAMFGKGHITPEWEQSPQVGPFDHWPTGLGFQHFYGFLNFDTDQFAPTLVNGTTPIQPPRNDPRYTLDRDLANHTIAWISQLHGIAPAKRWFIYYAPGSTHAPQQAPKKWIEKFKGKFDMGWDRIREQILARQEALGIVPKGTKLTPRPAELKAWDSLSPDERRVDERFMEVYAAQLAHCDYEIGRVIDYLRKSGELKNTLIFYIQGDNGASAEGGPDGELYEQRFMVRDNIQDSTRYRLSRLSDMGGPSTYEIYPAEWAWAMDTPFKWFKQIASHFGGTRNAMVISWPGHIKDPGKLRTQYSYIDDVVPTILQAVGIRPPRKVNGVPQQSIDGTSLMYTFADPDARTRHDVQYIEMEQNVSIYKNGWVAATTPMYMPWKLMGPPQQTVDLDKRRWQLYNVARDFSEADDLAKTDPEKLAEMQRVFIQQGLRYKVFPVHSPGAGAANEPSLAAGRSTFTYPSGVAELYLNDAPHTAGRSFTISAEVSLSQPAANGVLVAQGGQFSGYSFYMLNGRLAFCYNDVPPFVYTVRSKDSVAVGRHLLAASFTADSPTRGTGGWLTLSVDGRPVGRGRIAHTFDTNWVSNTEGLDTGQDLITAVSSDYTVPDKFSGKIEWIKFDLK